MIKETRVILKNAGIINPESIDEYIAAGGYDALRKALSMSPASVIDEMMEGGGGGRLFHRHEATVHQQGLPGLSATLCGCEC